MRSALRLALSCTLALAAAPAAAQHEHHPPVEAATPAAAATRFPADAVLRENMQAIRAAVDKLAHHERGHLDAAQAQTLAAEIQGRVQDTIARCKLPPDADAALHAVIVPLLRHATELQKDPAKTAEVAPMRAALEEYARRFDEAGSAAD